MRTAISSISISGFRQFDGLELKHLGRVNLVTGRNNTGKSSLLEAFLLLSDGASIISIRRLLNLREELGEPILERPRLESLEVFSPIGSIFKGVPDITNKIPPITIKSGGASPMHLEISVGYFSRTNDADGNSRLEPQEEISASENELVVALVCDSHLRKRIISTDRFRNPIRSNSLVPSDKGQMLCNFVGPTSSDRTTNLADLWDNVALSDRERDLVEALRIVAPDIDGVAMIGGEDGLRRNRTAIVRSKRFPKPVQLKLFGDGLSRVFGIVLSIINAKDGLLLIDEFENGMHHTVQYEVWRVLFRLAKSLNVQVFATSHSWDAVEAFQKAAAEDPEEGVLIRLSRMGDAVIPTIFTEDELAIATRDRIEVR